jgi:hypothetical protein
MFMSLIECFTYDLEKLVQYELETAIVPHRLDSLACRESFDFLTGAQHVKQSRNYR